MDGHELRIGDAERSQAVQLLVRQAQEGRLDPSELAERTAHVLVARTRGDLAELFADLPVDPPSAAAESFPAYPDLAPASAAAPAPGSGPDRELAEGAITEQRRHLTRQRRIYLVGVAALLASWPIAVVVIFLTGGAAWWLALVPLLASVGYGMGVLARGRSEPPRIIPPKLADGH